MGNISALADISTKATALSNLILVSPQSIVGYQPQSLPDKNGQPLQPAPAILFNYEGENAVQLNSDITDHFVEDNTAIEDQVALRPEVITVAGYIGELNDVSPIALSALKKVADKLSVLVAYTPALTESALIAYNEAAFAYNIGKNAVNAAISSWGSINGGSSESVIANGQINVQSNQTKQQVAFQQFYGYWRARTLFTVQTPWAIFENCAISSLRAIQGEETRMITDFEVSFKVMRFAQTQIALSDFSAVDFQGRASGQASSLVDLGTSTPQSVPLTLADAIAGTA